MTSSLRQIRNSATKKKVEKMFERLGQKQEERGGQGGMRGGERDLQLSRSPSPSDDYDMLDDSAIFSEHSELTAENLVGEMTLTSRRKG